MAPALVLVAVFLYGVVNGVLQGFGIMPFIGMADFTFEYWAEALTRSDLAASVGFSLYIALVSSVVALAGGIVLSAALCAVRRTRLLALIDVQIPLMCAHILVVLAAVSLFSGSGLVPRILYHLGLVSAPTDFPSVVGDPSGWGILATYVWKEVPFVAFCTVTLMGHVSDRFGEAAAAMGASPVRSFLTAKERSSRPFWSCSPSPSAPTRCPFSSGPHLPRRFPCSPTLSSKIPISRTGAWPWPSTASWLL